MLSFRRWTGLAVALGLGAACGGSAFSSAGNGEDGGAGDGAGAVGSSGGLSSGGDAMSSGASSGSSGTSEGGGTSSGVQDGSSDGLAMGSDAMDGSTVVGVDGSPTDAPAMNCPNVRGTYTVAIVQGAGGGCSNLNPAAPQCIRQGTQGSCSIELLSNPSGGVPAAVNGSGVLQSNGSLGNASLQLGDQNRSGCTATWDPVASTFTVDCGGMDSSQSCVVALARTGVVATNCN